MRNFNFLSLDYQDILDNLLREERKNKVKDNKENDVSITNSVIIDAPELAPVDFVEPATKKNTKMKKEINKSACIDDDDEITLDELENAVPVKPSPVPSNPTAAPVKLPQPKVTAPKTLTAKNIDSSIFNELQGINFDAEIRDEAEGEINWNTVSVDFLK